MGRYDSDRRGPAIFQNAVYFWFLAATADRHPCFGPQFGKECLDMRYSFENPFISHQCIENGIDKAPIATGINETYAQCNEDLIIEAVLRANLRRAGRAMDSIRYIEIGANHPIQTSSTYLLHRVYQASGVLVEPNPVLAERLAKLRPRDTVVECVVTASDAATVDLHIHEKNELSSISADHIARFIDFGGREGITNTIRCRNMHINQFMKTYGTPWVDYLSIDLEGADLEVLAAMDPVFRPTIIQCEHDGRIEQFSDVLRDRGYGLLGITDVNTIFICRGMV
jgi:FkbM family methyltransferase